MNNRSFDSTPPVPLPPSLLDGERTWTGTDSSDDSVRTAVYEASRECPVPAALPSGALPFGRYVLLCPLGKGGMGEIWKAVDPSQGRRPLVIKRLLPGLANQPQLVSMFFAEAMLAIRLRHPNVVEVYEVGQVDGDSYIAMEYVAGRDLGALIGMAMRHRCHLPVGLGVQVIRDVCSALAYVHQVPGDEGEPLGLIHRDVSPSNILVGTDGRARLLDFGIAKTQVRLCDQTHAGQLKGKLSYMSPERLDGSEVDHRTDIFGAGVVLHEFLTGRRLFKGANDLETMCRIRDLDIAPPSRWSLEVPPALDRICMKALARDRRRRYYRAAQMAEELDAVLRHIGWREQQLGDTVRALVRYDADPSGRSTLRSIERARAPERRGGLWLALVLFVLVASLAAYGLARAFDAVRRGALGAHTASTTLPKPSLLATYACASAAAASGNTRSTTGRS
jgi:serine/threonine protein kinase